MRIASLAPLVLTLTIVCASGPVHADAAAPAKPAVAPPAGGAAPTATTATTAAGRVVLLGVASRQHRHVCDPPMTERWVDPHIEVGWIELVGPHATEAEPLLGKLVVVEGAAAPAPDRPRNGDSMSCPGHQMRDDWVLSSSGMRIRRDRSAAARALVALRPERVREYRGLEIRRNGGDLAITFRNDLGVEMRRLTLTLHYEGCHGKPGRTERAQTVERLAPGAETRITFPAAVRLADGPPGRAEFAAHSLQLDAEGPVTLDADVSTPTVECPDRHR